MSETKRPLDLEALTLYRGAHDPDGKMCIMEAVAYVAGEPWSDRPACACPTISAFLRSWNDALSDSERQQLKPYIPRLIGTNDGKSITRSWMCFDWLTRECAAAFLDLTPNLMQHANFLRGLPEITGRAPLDAAWPTIKAAWASAGAAAGASAGAAAWAAADRKLAPVVARLQTSAHTLIERMLAL